MVLSCWFAGVRSTYPPKGMADNAKLVDPMRLVYTMGPKPIEKVGTAILKRRANMKWPNSCTVMISPMPIAVATKEGIINIIGMKLLIKSIQGYPLVKMLVNKND